MDPARRLMAFNERTRTGTLCLYGVWRGRPMDNLEVPLSATWEDNCLRIVFDGAFQVEVWDPAPYVVKKWTLHIPSASRVRLSPLPENPGYGDPSKTWNFVVKDGVLDATAESGWVFKEAKLTESAFRLV